jgi:peptidoglycan-associated lipoprotein
MKYISALLLSSLLLSCQLVGKNQKEFNEEEFFNEDKIDLTVEDENIEESYEIVEDADQMQKTNEEILKKEEEFVEVEIDEMLYFDFGSQSLSDEAKKIADLQYLWLKENPNINITIEGHCDDRGTREYNISLGAKRAESLKSYFVSRGIDKSRIDTISFGEEKPYLVGAGEEVWKKNRRAFIAEK